MSGRGPTGKPQFRSISDLAQPARSTAAICAVAGGTLWALTPLRQPLFHAGRSPAEGEAVFRIYNALIVVIAVLLTVALVRLLHEAYRPTGRAFLVGWWMMLVGQAMIFGGSLIGVMLGGWMTDFVMAAQDAGFMGALVAALGAVPLGIVGLRHAGLPTPASAMCGVANRSALHHAPHGAWRA